MTALKSLQLASCDFEVQYGPGGLPAASAANRAAVIPAALQPLQHLTDLCLSGLPIDSEAALQITFLTQLRRLNLSFCKLDDETVGLVASRLA